MPNDHGPAVTMVDGTEMWPGRHDLSVLPPDVATPAPQAYYESLQCSSCTSFMWQIV
ncbi:hypothetical protein J6590_034071 [Homalodisca vitripennis]|nr:hypothetical protein J6590_034071 [Homalodisca vitripennis]